MRAALLLGHGDLSQLVYRENVPDPQPQPGEVLVRVRAAAVNNTDVNLRTGWYSRAAEETPAQPERADAISRDAGWAGDALTFPRIQGADGCGHIVATGEGVSARRIGERVLLDPIIRSAETRTRYLGSDIPGTFAELVAVPADNAVPIRSRLQDEELASFPCSYLAAENMLTRAGLERGETVLITGASGGVGSAAVQLARSRDACVVAVAESSKAALVGSLGASRVLPRGTDLILALGPASVDVVIDVVGGAQFAQLLEILRPQGRYACAGAIGGPKIELDLRTLYLKDLSLLGCTIPSAELFRRLVAKIEAGAVRPLVSAVYPLKELAAAQSAFLDRRHVGKIVLVI